MTSLRVCWTAVALGLSCGAWGATITVDDDAPADYRRVQDAIDAAAAGDEIVVHVGVYSDTLTRRSRFRFPLGGQFGGQVVEAWVTALAFLKDGVKVRGMDPKATILDARGSGTVVLANGVGAQTRLEGFTIQGGSGSDFGLPLLTSGTGGGVMIFAGAPVISNNIIRANRATNYGGGVEVAFSYYTPARIQFNQILENSAGLEGAAIDITMADPIVEGNIIVGNRVTAGSGGGVNVYGSLNTYIYFNQSISPAIVMNTIALNEASHGGGVAVGGGAFTTAPAPIISGNIIYQNIGQEGGGIFTTEFSSSLTLIQANDVFLNEGGNYSGEDQTGKNGNISADPFFIGTSTGNWRLADSSPCVDTASVGRFVIGSQVFSISRTDFEGSLRPLDGNHDLEAVPDMGAFEFNRGDILGLRFLADVETLSWRPEATAVAYNVYRGPIEALLAGSFGSCFATMDTSLLDARFTDSEVPLTGSGFFYLVSQRDAAGEQSLGFDSRGMERVNAAPCP